MPVRSWPVHEARLKGKRAVWPSKAHLLCAEASGQVPLLQIQNEGSLTRKKQKGEDLPQKLFGNSKKSGQDVWCGQGLPEVERFQQVHRLQVPGDR